MAVHPDSRDAWDAVRQGKAIAQPKNVRNIEALAKARRREPNKYHLAFRAWCEAEKRAGRIAEFGEERVSLRLPGGTWYRPDFDVWEYDSQWVSIPWDGCRAPGPRPKSSPFRNLVLYEVKGFLTEKARIKLREVAAAFPWAEIRVAYRKKGGVYVPGARPFEILTVGSE